MKRIYPILCLGFFLISTFSFGQEQDERLAFPRFDIAYSYQIPGGDMADRFGNNSGIGLGFHYKTKSNVFYEVYGHFAFGGRVKENGILEHISSQEGQVFDLYGQAAVIALYERGFQMGIGIGYILPYFQSNANSGFYVKIGPTFLQHKIRIEHQNHEIPSLNKEYTKGYDRLTNGLGLEEEIGYYFTHPNNRYNFRVGFTFLQASTQNRRSYNFDEKRRDDRVRRDLLSGIRISWAIPILKRKSENYYMY